MKLEYLNRMDDIVRKSGARSAGEVMDFLGYVFIDPGPSIDGFITRVKRTRYYGVSSSLSGIKREFAIYHEGFHGLCGHLDLPGFLPAGGMHAERGTFADYKLVADTERDANIGAADQVIDTGSILEMLGYDSLEVDGYGKSLHSFEQAVSDYRDYCRTAAANGSSEERIRKMQAWQDELGRMYRELEEQARDIACSGVCLSAGEIAGKFGVPACIIDYKLRALRIRNYRIPSVELLSFGKVFRSWNA